MKWIKLTWVDKIVIKIEPKEKWKIITWKEK